MSELQIKDEKPGDRTMMDLRQCDMMSIIEVKGKAYTYCEKTEKKKTLNKCLKCIKKSETGRVVNKQRGKGNE